MIRRHGEQAFGKENLTRLKYLRESPVYELSHVAGLFDDWNRERIKRVPRRPPHDNLWAEWRIEYEGPVDFAGKRLKWDFTVGAFMYKTEIRTTADDSPDLRAVIEKSRYCYMTRMFRFMNGMPVGIENQQDREYVRMILNTPTADVDSHIWLLNEDGSELECLYLEHRQKAKLFKGENLRLDQSCLGLSMMSLAPGKRSCDKLCTPWPMWMCFSLLHCKNVETVQCTQARDTRRVVKSGNLPRCDYKVLRVKLPQFMMARGPVSNSTCRTCRFHLRSGHFKNLTHPRYVGHDDPRGNWHWWPATWVGSAQAGIVLVSRTRVIG
jgi:hypothetical protein